MLNQNQFSHASLSGDGPKYEMVCVEENNEGRDKNVPEEALNYQRARVLCSYDAKDNTELNLTANEVSCLTEL